MRLQALVQAIYPPLCLGCETPVTEDFAFCGTCWRDMPFIGGTVCGLCGAPLPGSEPEGTVLRCDDCLRHPPPWTMGRAVAVYDGLARRMVLLLKHGDRLDLARPLGTWLARAAQPLLRPDTLIAPVPLHWLRLLRRRANQAALLSSRVAQLTGAAHCPDLLLRRRRTPSQGRQGRAARQANLAGALSVHPRHLPALRGRPILLVDDVMTSGATLAAATCALQAAGAGPVSVLVVARSLHGHQQD